jgi:LPXTG-site transpeptidase (sortase) family protein
VRRAIGIGALAVGALLLAYTGASYARGAIARAAARAEWAAIEARRARLDGIARLDHGAAAATAIGAPVGRLVVRSIGLDEVIVEGVDDETLNAGPGHLPGSVLPGEAGNAVISAHRDRHFRPLGRIAIGDTIDVETLRGPSRWIVVSRRVVGAGVPALFETGTPTLTLTTCWPVRYLGTAPDRLLVQAVQLTDAGRTARGPSVARESAGS